MASLIQRVFRHFTGRKNENVYTDIYEALANMGVNIVKDEKLAGRLAALEELYDQIMGGRCRDVECVKARVLMLDKLIKVVAMAWGRGGDNPKFSEMITHWEALKALFMDLVSFVEDNPVRKEEDDEVMQELAEVLSVLDTVTILDNIAKRDLLPAGWVIVAVTFKEADVTPKHIMVVQNMAVPMSSPPESRPDAMSELLMKAYEEHLKKRKLGESS